jgi:hypothetical protein
MYVFNVFITTLIPNYQDGIITGLAKKGYMVGPASKDGKVVAEGGNAGTLLALSVYRQEEIDTHKIHQDVCEVLVEVGARTYSLVVALASDVAWSGPNFDLPIVETVKKPTSIN